MAAARTKAIQAGVPTLRHMPQLDALRAFAVLAVVLHHNFGVSQGADLGVKLFFTLSGFLITGLLLRSRDIAESAGLPRRHFLARFYARRVLRIFPLYYFVISIAIIVNLEPVREISVWLFTYTINFRMAAQGWYEPNFALSLIHI